MREKRIIIFTLSSILFLLLSISIFLNYFTERKDAFIIDVCLALLGSIFLSLVVTTIGYYSDKRRIIKEYGDILLNLLNVLCSYKYMSKHNTDTAINNLSVLSKSRELVVYTLGEKYYEYSPFFKCSRSNKYIYSSFEYLYSFMLSISSELMTLERNQHCISNGASRMAFEKINNKIYNTISNFGADGEIISQNINNILYDDLKKYIEEYINLVNGKHKRTYKNMEVDKFKSSSERA